MTHFMWNHPVVGAFLSLSVFAMLWNTSAPDPETAVETYYFVVWLLCVSLSGGLACIALASSVARALCWYWGDSSAQAVPEDRIYGAEAMTPHAVYQDLREAHEGMCDNDAQAPGAPPQTPFAQDIPARNWDDRRIRMFGAEGPRSQN